MGVCEMNHHELAEKLETAKVKGQKLPEIYSAYLTLHGMAVRTEKQNRLYAQILKTEVARSKADQAAKKAAALLRPSKSEKVQARKNEDRKKYLLGAFVLELMQKNGIGAEMMSYESQSFNTWLIRDADRALFGLHPLL